MLRSSASLRGSSLSKGFKHYKDKLNPGISRSHSLLMEKGQGSYLWDADGKKYLDFTCGIGVTNLGHCHPRLVKVVQNQAAKLWHGQVGLGVHTAMADLVDEMSTILPKELDNLTFVSTGAEAVEAALKIARSATKRQNAVVVQGSYHGRTNACLALTTSKYVYHQTVRPLMPGVTVVPPPYTTQMKLDPQANVDEMVQRCVGILEDLIYQQTHPSEIAMLLIEPVLGEGGYLPMPAAYLRALREVCTKHGILLAFDEVQTGFGRTGTNFTFEQVGVTPDILVYAKGIANGLPLAGVATRNEIAKLCPLGTHGGTYAGNALATASGAEVIRIMREEGILDNVAKRSIQIFNGLKRISQNPKVPIQEVRGRGLMIGVQFTNNTPAGFATDVVNEATERGLLLLSTSKFEVLRLIPSLLVTEAEVSSALGALEESLLAAAAKKGLPSSETLPLVPCCAAPCYSGAQQPCRWISSRK